MLSPLFHGKGPRHFQKKHTWGYKGLLVGTGPLAVDAARLRIIEAKRLTLLADQQPCSARATSSSESNCPASVAMLGILAALLVDYVLLEKSQTNPEPSRLLSRRAGVNSGRRARTGGSSLTRSPRPEVPEP